jgi:predicted metal-dependent hydrolase
MTRRRSPAGQLALPLAAVESCDDACDTLPSASAGPVVSPASPPPPPAIVVVRRRGTRRYVLRVLDDGTVRVTVPWWGSRREALAFAASQQDWIDRQRAKRRAPAALPWHPGRLVLLDGEAHPLTIGDDGSVWLAGYRVAPDADAPEALRRAVQTWLRARARRHLPSALLALASQHDLAVTRVTIRDQVSRWGSCSRHGAISLNWRLVQMPPWVRDYVLVHELMHRRQLNHSPRFWRLVAAACPRYLEARRWLRTDGQALFA